MRSARAARRSGSPQGSANGLDLHFPILGWIFRRFGLLNSLPSRSFRQAESAPSLSLSAAGRGRPIRNLVLGERDLLGQRIWKHFRNPPWA